MTKAPKGLVTGLDPDAENEGAKWKCIICDKQRPLARNSRNKFEWKGRCRKCGTTMRVTLSENA